MCYSALVQRDLTFLGEHYGATVVRDQFAAYEQLSAENSKLYPKLRSRIFPGHYAPIIFQSQGQKWLKLMRYGAYPPPHIPHPEKYTTYNARYDNLQSPFWGDAFMHHHGCIVLRGMYEWVLVKDLLKAGVVTLDKVKDYFAKQSQARREKLLAQGKKYRPTPTELKDPLQRQIIIEFTPTTPTPLTVPVIFSAYPSANPVDGLGFAIVTDEPPKEVRAAGHDRCPITLTPSAMDLWLDPEHGSLKSIYASLSQREEVIFAHDLEPTGS